MESLDNKKEYSRGPSLQGQARSAAGNAANRLVFELFGGPGAYATHGDQISHAINVFSEGLLDPNADDAVFGTRRRLASFADETPGKQTMEVGLLLYNWAILEGLPPDELEAAFRPFAGEFAGDSSVALGHYRDVWAQEIESHTRYNQKFTD